MQARDAAGNNKTDSADRWAMRYWLVGGNVAEDVDLMPLGSGVYSATLLLNSVGSGNASLEVYLVDAQVTCLVLNYQSRPAQSRGNLMSCVNASCTVLF